MRGPAGPRTGLGQSLERAEQAGNAGLIIEVAGLDEPGVGHLATRVEMNVVADRDAELSDLLLVPHLGVEPDSHVLEFSLGVGDLLADVCGRLIEQDGAAE